jgi:LysR family transcriptional regulator, low CO2-responsive transcriptional regulator
MNRERHPMKHVTLRQLRIWRLVAEHLSFSKAARELHLTQPAISIQVKQLQQSAGVPLFEQIGKKLHLTEAGKELARYAASVTDLLRAAEETLASHRGITGGIVRIGVVSTAKYFAPSMLAAFTGIHPDVRMQLSVANREDIIRLLADNAIDLAIMGRPPKGLRTVASPFAKHPLVVIAPAGHPLAGKHSIPLARLANETFLMREPGSGTRMSMEKTFRDRGVHYRAGMEISSNETIKQAVMAGLGLSFLSVHTVGLELGAGRLVVLDVAGLPVMRDWYVIHLKDKRLTPVAAALKEFLLANGARIIQETTGVDAVGEYHPLPRPRRARRPAAPGRVGARPRPRVSSSAPPE